MNKVEPAEVLEQVAREYRADGYDVVVHPRPPVLPAFLDGLRPDLVALRHDQNVLVEIVSGLPRGGSPEMSEFARRVEGHPDWRFDVVHVPDREARPESLGSGEIRQQLRFVRAALAQGYASGALVLGWSLTEAALRLLADEHAIAYDPRRPRELLRMLAAAGLLDQQDYDALVRGWEARSRVAHGFRIQPGDEAFVSFLLERAAEAGRQWSRNPLFGEPSGGAPLELVVDRLYDRTTLHEAFGGSRQGGIAPSRDYPVILLFTRHGNDLLGPPYPPGSIAYSGEGQTGDMQLVRGNRAILEHRETGKELHLFEYVRPGKVRYLGQFECAGYVQSEEPDWNGQRRKMITFHLTPVGNTVVGKR